MKLSVPSLCVCVPLQTGTVQTIIPTRMNVPTCAHWTFHALENLHFLPFLFTAQVTGLAIYSNNSSNYLHDIYIFIWNNYTHVGSNCVPLYLNDSKIWKCRFRSSTSSPYLLFTLVLYWYLAKIMAVSLIQIHVHSTEWLEYLQYIQYFKSSFQKQISLPKICWSEGYFPR